jgi:uncharacterized membrane protein YbhN (UPF0104 family)
LFYTADIQNTLSLLRRADYRPVLPVLAVTVAVHVVRAKRWALLLGSNSVNVPLTSALSALITGYLVNNFVPRLGEITRCITITGKTGVPISKAFGTVAAERITDLLCLVFTFSIALSLQYSLLSGIFSDFFLPFFSKLLIEKPWIAYLVPAGIAGLVILVWVTSRYLLVSDTTAAARWWLQLKAGILSPFEKNGRIAYYLLTITVWVCYFLMTFLWFNCFELTSMLSWKAGLAVMVMGSLAKIVPIQAGGMGAYHLVVTATLMLFGISETTGLALAIIIHGFQLMFALLAGLSVMGGNALENLKMNK